MWQQPLFWGIVALAALFMEFWAMFLHGRLWHRWLWVTHRSHHEPRPGRFELNDVFAVFHAVVAMALIIGGLESNGGQGSLVPVAIGIGMTVFGFAYFTVHDGLAHGRLPVAFLARIPYLRRVRNAHRVHHNHDAAGQKHDRVPYGLFLGTWELARAKARRDAQDKTRT